MADDGLSKVLHDLTKRVMENDASISINIDRDTSTYFVDGSPTNSLRIVASVVEGEQITKATRLVSYSVRYRRHRLPTVPYLLAGMLKSIKQEIEHKEDE